MIIAKIKKLVSVKSNHFIWIIIVIIYEFFQFIINEYTKKYNFTLRHDIITSVLEKYSRGRRGQFRKLLGDASLAWVRLPPSPPKIALGLFYFY